MGGLWLVVELHYEGYSHSLRSRIVWQPFPNILDLPDSLNQLLVFEEWFPHIMDLHVSQTNLLGCLATISL